MLRPLRGGLAAARWAHTFARVAAVAERILATPDADGKCAASLDAVAQLGADARDRLYEQLPDDDAHVLQRIARGPDSRAHRWADVDAGARAGVPPQARFPARLVVRAERAVPYAQLHAQFAPVPLLLHSLAHAEVNAIHLCWDTIARFGRSMPPRFALDLVSIAGDEARHMRMLDSHMRTAYGVSYGDVVSHDRLALLLERTRHSLPARLWALALVEEMRAVDGQDRLRHRLESWRDASAAGIVDTICHEEQRHVHLGALWFAAALPEPRDAGRLFRALAVSYGVALPRSVDAMARRRIGVPIAWWRGGET